MTQTPICIAGVARAGKDSFAAMLMTELQARRLTTKRFALADELKKRIYPFLLDLSGIDIFKCKPEDKELARDLMVAVGKIKRFQSQGTFWTSLLEKQIRESNVQYPVITDIRYNVFPEDEIHWAQKKMNGLLVHVSRIDADGKEIPPANQDEAKNDPMLKELSDYQVRWETFPPSNEGISAAPQWDYVAKFITDKLKL